VSSPAAWYSADLQADTSWRFALTNDHVAELDEALRFGAATGRPLAQWSAEDFPLPTLSNTITQWRYELTAGRGLVYISGVPVKRWGTGDSERFFWALGLHLGMPGAQNPEGHLLGHIQDTGAQKLDPMVRLYQTADGMAYHCDAADVVGLLCLQSAAEGGTSRIASSVTVWNEMLRREPPLAARLFEPIYVDLRNERSPEGNPWNSLTPCAYANGVLRTFYHGDYFRSVERHGIRLSADVRRLLDLYDDIAQSPETRFDMDLAPGDIQLISNHTVIHARTPYVDHPGQRRHLLRLWLSL
jgi:hypothetical protein